MSNIVNFNAQVAPMEHVEKVVRQEQDYAKVGQDARMAAAAEHLGRDNEQVAKTSPGSKNRRTGRRGQDDEKAHEQEQSFTGRERGSEPGDDENFAEDASPDMWSGKIVNLKV